jgi:hypothetical protein
VNQEWDSTTSIIGYETREIGLELSAVPHGRDRAPSLN